MCGLTVQKSKDEGAHVPSIDRRRVDFGQRVGPVLAKWGSSKPT